MKITFYSYNAFVIEWGTKKIAIDPGASFYLPDFFRTLIPKSKWKGITHIFVTHGDPDHHWNTDRVAAISGAKVICNEKMVRIIDDEKRMLAPRKGGLTFTTPVKELITIGVNQTIDVDEMQITGIKGAHGPLTFKLGTFSKTLHEGANERFGYGEMGFQIKLLDKTIVNLGDTILHSKEWESVQSPDVLMIPIGGKIPGNTMDEEEALQAVRIMKPKLVIPVHYDCGILFSRCYNPADTNFFKEESEKMGAKCVNLRNGESVKI